MREEIVHHCSHCRKCQSSECSVCFFGTVDFGKPDLGSFKIYQRAFRYLRVFKIRGFKRDKTFGNYLNVEVSNG